MNTNSKNQIVEELKKLFLFVEEKAKDDYSKKDKIESEYYCGYLKTVSIEQGYTTFGPPLCSYAAYKQENRFEYDKLADLVNQLTPESIKEIEPELWVFLNEKIKGAEYGGFYQPSLTFQCTIQNHTFKVVATNKEHLEVYKTKLRKLAKEYEQLPDFYNHNLDGAIQVLLSELYPAEVSFEHAKQMIEYMLKPADRAMNELKDKALSGLQLYISSVDKSEKQTDAVNEMLCYASLCILRYEKSAYSYQVSLAKEALKSMAKLGYAKAKSIMKYGTGTIADQYMEYSDANVSCLANDVSKTVDFKIKNETEEAYKAMMGFLAELIKQGFPKSYSIKFNSKVKNYLPVKGLKDTPTNQFFTNCAAYPTTYPIMKDYVKTVAGGSYHYKDTQDEDQQLLTGGYAAFALGFANQSNFDVVSMYMKANDVEHYTAPDYFVSAFIQHWDITPETKEVIADCLLHMNGAGFWIPKSYMSKVETFKNRHGFWDFAGRDKFFRAD